MTILSLAGPVALTAFARRKLLRELGERDSSITAVDASFIHFVELSAPLDPEAEDRLQRLLHYGAQPGSGEEPGAGKVAGAEGLSRQEILITPRPGTLSPWSSKATNIVHNCGLTQVVRVERGLCRIEIAARGDRGKMLLYGASVYASRAMWLR